MHSTIFGRVVRLEDVKVLEKSSVLKLIVSVPLARSKRTGEQYAPTELITIEVWNNLIPSILDNFEVGSSIACTAKFKGTESWVSNKSGQAAARTVWTIDQISWPARQLPPNPVPDTTDPNFF